MLTRLLQVSKNRVMQAGGRVERDTRINIKIKFGFSIRMRLGRECIEFITYPQKNVCIHCCESRIKLNDSFSCVLYFHFSSLLNAGTNEAIYTNHRHQRTQSKLSSSQHTAAEKFWANIQSRTLA